MRGARLKAHLAGGGGAPTCTWPSTTGRNATAVRLGWPPGNRWRLTRGRRYPDHDVKSLLLNGAREHMTTAPASYWPAGEGGDEPPEWLRSGSHTSCETQVELVVINMK